MAAKALEIHPAALAELKAAVAWYQERSEPAAAGLAAEIDRAVDLIVQSPSRWPRGEHATRKYVLQRFPFAIVYRERKTDIQVIAFAHGHRRPSYWGRRL